MRLTYNQAKVFITKFIHTGSLAYEKLKDGLTKKTLVKAIKRASSVAQTSVRVKQDFCKFYFSGNVQGDLTAYL